MTEATEEHQIRKGYNLHPSSFFAAWSWQLRVGSLVRCPAGKLRRTKSPDCGRLSFWQENLALDLEDLLIELSFEEVRVLLNQIAVRHILDAHEF